MEKEIFGIDNFKVYVKKNNNAYEFKVIEWNNIYIMSYLNFLDYIRRQILNWLDIIKAKSNNSLGIKKAKVLLNEKWEIYILFFNKYFLPMKVIKLDKIWKTDFL